MPLDKINDGGRRRGRGGGETKGRKEEEERLGEGGYEIIGIQAHIFPAATRNASTITGNVEPSEAALGGAWGMVMASPAFLEAVT